MSDDTTTTEAVETKSADAAIETAPTQLEETTSAEAEVSSEEPTTEQTNENKGDDVASWAKSKGLEINPDNPNEVKLANMQREAEKKMHQSTTQASELKNIINEESSNFQGDDASQMKQEIQVMKANQAVNDFYQQNPDAQQFDADMAEIVRSNPNAAKAGIEALYAMAKVRSLKNGGEDQLKSAGKTEALKDLSSKQKVASASSSATSAQMASKGITLSEVSEHTRAGDVAWLREHSAEIDAL